jgi:hypothetical protein
VGVVGCGGWKSHSAAASKNIWIETSLHNITYQICPIHSIRRKGKDDLNLKQANKRLVRMAGHFPVSTDGPNRLHTWVVLCTIGFQLASFCSCSFSFKSLLGMCRASYYHSQQRHKQAHVHTHVIQRQVVRSHHCIHPEASIKCSSTRTKPRLGRARAMY